MTALWHCWPKVHRAAPLKAARRAHHARRIGRAVKRAGTVAIGKPAIVGWTCVSLWWPAPLGQPASASIPPAAPEADIAGDIATWSLLPCCGGIETMQPVIEFPVIFSPTLLPDVPEIPTTPPTRIPEPSSLEFLLVSLFMFAIGGRIARNRRR